MNQKTHLRNEVELSPKRFLAETSTEGGSAQHLRPKFQPNYHLVNELVARTIRVNILKRNLDIFQHDMSSKMVITLFSLFAESDFPHLQA